MYTPTLDRDVERNRIFQFLKNAKHNHIIKNSEIKEISNLAQKEWFNWAVERLMVENKTLTKIGTNAGQDFVISFSKKALDQFEATRETDWNEISEVEFKEKFSKLDFENASIIVDGQMELYNILTTNLNQNLKNYQENKILKIDLEAKIKMINEFIEKGKEIIGNLSKELSTISSRHDMMREMIINK